MLLDNESWLRESRAGWAFHSSTAELLPKDIVTGAVRITLLCCALLSHLQCSTGHGEVKPLAEALKPCRRSGSRRHYSETTQSIIYVFS